MSTLAPWHRNSPTLISRHSTPARRRSRTSKQPCSGSPPVAAATQRASRAPEEIRLLPASKTVPEERISLAVTARYHEFGENKVQETRREDENLAGPDISWSVIGHLRSNKAKDVAAFADEHQTLDRLRVAGRCSTASCRLPAAAGGRAGQYLCRGIVVRPITRRTRPRRPYCWSWSLLSQLPPTLCR